MIQHFASRTWFKAVSLAQAATDSNTIIAAGKSYIFYGAVLSSANSSAYFTDIDGNLLWATHHGNTQPSAVTDFRFIGTNGLIAVIVNHGATQVLNLAVFLSDTGEGALS
jgi:hypothetical protein